MNKKAIKLPRILVKTNLRRDNNYSPLPLIHNVLSFATKTEANEWVSKVTENAKSSMSRNHINNVLAPLSLKPKLRNKNASKFLNIICCLSEFIIY